MKTYEHYCLFGEPWWLDIASGPAGWDEVRIETDGRLEARLPFILRRSRGLTRIAMPPLTQTLGPWFADDSGKYATRLSREKDLVESLVTKLPKHDIFSQAFHNKVTNFLPWHWRGYEPSQRYSYVINDLDDTDLLWAELQSNIRGDVRKATNRYHLEIRDDLGTGPLLDICNKSAKRQGRGSLPAAVVTRIVDGATKAGRGRATFAVDRQNNVHAGIFVVWDDRTTYYILGGGDPRLRSSGAHSLLLWDAIVYASRVSETFDFEGSMVETIERFFRAFGACQQRYMAVWRVQSRILAAGFHLRSALSCLTRS